MRAPKTRTDLRQEQIAQAALEIIGEVGLPGLSIAKIAKKVGITASNIYRHYTNKDQVIDAVLELVHCWLMDNVSAAQSESIDALERLKIVLERHANMLDANPAVLLLMVSAGQHGKKSQVLAILQAYQLALKTIIVQGQEASVLESDFDPQSLVLIFLGILLPGALMLNLTHGAFDIQQHVALSWPMYKKMIQK